MLTTDLIQTIDARIAQALRTATAVGTVAARTSGTDAMVVFDGSQGPIPVKVAGSATAHEGNRVYLARFGLWWTIIGAAQDIGAYERVQDVVLTSTATAITFSNIPQDFTHLKLIGTMRSDLAATQAVDCRIRCNGDSGARYSYLTLDVRETQAGGAPSVSTGAAQSGFDWAATVPAGATFSGTRGGFEVTIFDYTNTAYTAKEMWSVSGFADIGTLQHMHFRWGAWDPSGNPQAINALEFASGGGNFVAGSRISLWGIV